ncbi:hypothetical protein LINGRAHAP2_LOCUS24179 [Linum grandiflorum]
MLIIIISCVWIICVMITVRILLSHLSFCMQCCVRGSLWLFKLLKTNIRFTPHFFSSHFPSIHKIKTSLNSFPQMDTNSRCPIHPSIEITDDDLVVDTQRNALSLLGIFLGNIPPYPLVISNLKKKEQLEGSISITGLEFGLCQFIFSSENDKLKVLKKSPISTNKYFICLSNWEPPTSQAVALLVHALFWIHLCDLPRKYCTVKIGEKLGSLIGKVVLSTICEDIASHRLFLRIRVILNAARPLISEVGAVHNSFHIQTTVRYENIPLLCFTCGLLGHDKKHCPRRLFPSTSTSKFGPELRARRGWRQVDEISLRPLPHQPPESFWEPLNSRMNHFEMPAEEANPISAFLNDPVIMYEPFFQQSHPMSIKQELQITSVEAVAFFQNTGPPTVPPQLFDMNSRPQGIVIREPVEEEDYLEQSSPDTILFKTPETVLLELGDQKTSTDEIMAEQCAIEADLLAQKLKEAADSLAQASNAVPEAYKIGNPQSAEEMITTTDSLQVNEPETKSKGRKRQGSARKETASKKQNSDSKKVEAASLKWLPDDK